MGIWMGIWMGTWMGVEGLHGLHGLDMDWALNVKSFHGVYMGCCFFLYFAEPCIHHTSHRTAHPSPPKKNPLKS